MGSALRNFKSKISSTNTVIGVGLAIIIWVIFSKIRGALEMPCTIYQSRFFEGCTTSMAVGYRTLFIGLVRRGYF